eukprot:GFUD01038749.1.p1 GENE.GFUD01038749.1~~GFUD01038749.1.p1  ORF type:complete len:636 (-),score=130.97 GFUD01038749.1:4-1911(-)
MMLGILDTSSSSCNVCHIAMARKQVHYGASCCFSCRAFFRRNSLREDLSLCKQDGTCLISFIDRKSCTPCRYDKCLRVGMRKEFIAQVGGKRKRLKRSYEFENGKVKPIFQEPNSDFPLSQYCDEEASISHKRSVAVTISGDEEIPENYSSKHAKSAGKNEVDQPKMLIDDTSDTQSKMKTLEDLNFLENESQIDPDTGELITKLPSSDILDRFGKSIAQNVENPSTLGHSGYNFSPERSEGVFKVNCILSEKDNLIKSENIEIQESSSPLNTTDNILQFQNRHKKEKDHFVNSSSTDHILHYIHKKFKKRCNITVPANNQYPCQDEYMSIQNVKLNLQEENKRENLELTIIAKSPIPQKQNRKSVIVSRKSVIQPLFQKCNINEMTEDEDLVDGDISMVISLSIHELENIYTLEEESYLDHVLNLFDEKWNSVTLDEQTLHQTMNYCQTGIAEIVPVDYFQTINFYLRERLLGFLFSLNDMENLTCERQFHLLRKNISSIRILMQVLSYSLNDSDAETRFMFSKKDRKKLGPANLSIKPITITELTKWAPIPSNKKQIFMTRNQSLSSPFLKDKKIFVLMLMILLFEDKSDSHVNNISAQYWTMLKRYLEKRTAMLDINKAMFALEKLSISLNE